jgi:glycyl-tRNA synthetase
MRDARRARRRGDRIRHTDALDARALAREHAIMDALEQKQEAVNVAGANVRALKAQGADQADIAAAIDELKRLKVDLEKDLAALREAGNAEAKAKEEFRSKLGQLLEGRLFYIPSYKIYGGVAGLYDYGPPGCAVKSNVQQFWRQHFVLEESMLEVECPAVTPEVVLQASGCVFRATAKARTTRRIERRL